MRQTAIDILQESLDNPMKNPQDESEIYVPNLDGSIKPLDMTKSPLNVQGVYILGNRGGGSCLFHAIAQAFYPPYIEGYDSRRETPFNPESFIAKLRKDLAMELGLPRIKTAEGSPIWYDTLARGKLGSIAKGAKGEGLPMESDITLKGLQRSLLSGESLDDYSGELMIEFLGSLLELDIYVIDSLTLDVVRVDTELLHQGRSSCVLLNTPGHYELLLQDDAGTGYKTLFETTDPFIEAVKSRI